MKLFAKALVSSGCLALGVFAQSMLAQMLGFDDERAGGAPEGWTVAMTHAGGPPRWEAIKDAAAPSGSFVFAQLSNDATGSRFPMAVWQRATARDGAVSVKFKAVAGAKDQAAGVVWRYRDQDNYYIARANALEDNVVLYKVEKGERTAIAPRGSPPKTYGVSRRVPKQTWSTLRVDFRGNLFSVSFDGEKIFDAEDSTFPDAGKMGLWTKADSVTYFDDFLPVEGIPPAAIQQPLEGVPPGFRAPAVGKLAIPASESKWRKQRVKIREIVVKSLGEMPPRPSPSAVRILSVDRKDGYRIEKFAFHNGVDSDVPGYIAIPEGRTGRLPAVLTMHGHGSSKDNMFGYDPSSQNVAELLVKKGYVVCGIDNYFNGERKGKGPAGGLEKMERGSDQEMSLFKLNLWLGRTLWGMMLRDERIALDYLASRPEVDSARIGAQGMSMGSTRAWWLAAIDDRIKAVVGVACFTRYEDLIAARQLKAHGIYYFVPGILKHFDSEGVMALIAPRPFLALTGERDAGSPPEGMSKLDRILTRLYQTNRRPDAFRNVTYPETGHVYNEDMKFRMAAWFAKFL